MCRAGNIGLPSSGGCRSIVRSSRWRFHHPVAQLKPASVAILAAGLREEGNWNTTNDNWENGMVWNQEGEFNLSSVHQRTKREGIGTATKFKFILRLSEEALGTPWLRYENDSPAEGDHGEALPHEPLQQMSIIIAVVVTVIDEPEQPRSPLDNSWRLGVPAKGSRGFQPLALWYSRWATLQTMQGSMPTFQSYSRELWRELRMEILREHWRGQRKALEKKLMLETARRRSQWKALKGKLTLEKNQLWKRSLKLSHRRLKPEARRTTIRMPSYHLWGQPLQALTKRYGGKCGKDAKKETDGHMWSRKKASMTRRKNIWQPALHPPPDPRINASTGILILSFGYVCWQSLLVSLLCSNLSGLGFSLTSVRSIWGYSKCIKHHGYHALSEDSPCMDIPQSF